MVYGLFCTVRQELCTQAVRFCSHCKGHKCLEKAQDFWVKANESVPHFGYLSVHLLSLRAQVACWR